MIAFLVRFVGLLLLALGFSAFIVDGTRSIAGGGLSLTSIGKGALDFLPAALDAMHRSIAGLPGAFLWERLFDSLLLLPISIAFMSAGAALIFLTHRAERRPSFARA